jgi:subtilisin family serine protease
LPETWSYTDGDGVTIAVLDTGCDLDHTDLAPNLLEGYNVGKISDPPEDDNDHGTHVTGAICAVNNEYGMVGVAPKSKIIPIKVLDKSGTGDMSDVAKGIRHAIERKADLMCLSLGCAKPLASLRKAILAAAESGIPLFCAGGNIRKEMDALYPARYPETIAIAALDKQFKRADFSNTSKNNIDFLAPGVDILSTVRDNWYAVFSGSSMAVPFAVGAAALILAAKRKYGLRIDLNSVEDYRQAFRNHGVKLDKYTGDKLFAGYGVIQPEDLVTWIKTQTS